MRRKTTALIACLVLAGCTPRAWTKPGGSQATFNKEAYSCERDAQLAQHLGNGAVGVANARDMFNRCMQAAGWTEVPHGRGFEMTPPSTFPFLQEWFR
jgi:outer membrane biogenesis lipoprotein LolB